MLLDNHGRDAEEVVSVTELADDNSNFIDCDGLLVHYRVHFPMVRLSVERLHACLKSSSSLPERNLSAARFAGGEGRQQCHRAHPRLRGWCLCVAERHGRAGGEEQV